ncbi:uncharacterized protein LOC121700822 [Alosa sapidissima]|uniref:uncharacterized protein LOC121700822 n=1 Tax=Alosa sapidissima TaxID=34773 RepID=UPI001C08E1D1|nr:uncharacterized protein LOC121700822 [Alosa sapidissima]XP_041939978.1 uncharacterized protein LOC121700822 [Alosa sapidissima]
MSSDIHQLDYDHAPSFFSRTDDQRLQTNRPIIMASPAKKTKVEEETVVGHVHAVSPVKTSRQNVRYFEATLQTGREEFNRVVCFALEKRSEFIQASDNSQAVRLSRARKSISFGNPGGYDVLLSSASSVGVLDDLDFPRRTPPDVDQLTVAQVLALGPMQRVGTMELRVVQATGNRVVPVRGTPVELKVFEVCDATGQTGLTVWDRVILSVQEGRSYRFTTLTTRKEGDRTVVTTTPSTQVTTCAEVGRPTVLRPASAGGEEVVCGAVVGVKIVAKPRCPRCHAGQENLVARCSTHRCERCGLLQRTMAYIITYSGMVIVLSQKGEERSMALTNSAVFAYVRDNFLSSCGHDGAALEESVMALEEVEVTVSRDGSVVRFGKFAPAGPSVEQDGAKCADAAGGSTTEDEVLDGLDEVLAKEMTD